MRVLLVMGSTTGGIGVHVRSLAKGLASTGHQAVVLQDFRRIRAAAADADVVHAHGIRAGAAACVLVSRRKHLVVTLHNAPLPDASRIHHALSSVLERIIARRADVVLGASPDLVARAASHGARDARFAPIAAPLSPPPSRPRDAVRAELGLGQSPRGAQPAPSDQLREPSHAPLDDRRLAQPSRSPEPAPSNQPREPDLADHAPLDNRRLLLAIGRLAPQKDYATLLDALAILSLADSSRGRQQPDLLLAIAGEGPLHADLQHRIDAENLPVRLLGHRADIPDLLNAADAFVMCSTWEARPLALQEALRAGVPTVATAVGGIPELVGPAAVLVPPRRPHDLAEAIRAVLAPGTRMAAEISAWVATWPGPEEELEAVLAAYAPGGLKIVPTAGTTLQG